MNDFKKLRQMARERRDRLINDAKAEYEATIRQIATLERSLAGTNTVRMPSISAAIDSVIPSDREFTTDDIKRGLKALDPDRDWARRAIDSHIARLRERGVLRRVRRASAHERASYARADLPIKEDNRTLRDVIAAIVTRPMTLTEICVAVTESGYRTSQKGRHLRNSVACELREAGYRLDGERWKKQP